MAVKKRVKRTTSSTGLTAQQKAILKEAQEFEKKVYRTFLDKIDNSNILGFKTILGKYDGFINYFASHPVFSAVLGKSEATFNLYLRMSIADVITKDLNNMMNHTSGVVYPGVWEYGNIFVLVMSSMNFTYTPEDGAMLTLHPDKHNITHEDVEGFETGTVLKFREYNVLSFYAFATTLRNLAVVKIAEEINSNLPSALKADSSETVSHRMGRQLIEYIREDKKMNSYDVTKYDDLNDQANEFIKNFSPILMGYMSVLLYDSGIDSSAIRDTITSSKASFYYNEKTSNNKNISSLESRLCKANYIITTTINDNLIAQSKFNFTPADIFDLIYMPDERCDDDRIYNSLGKSIYDFLRQLVVHVVSLHIYKFRNLTNTSEQTEPVEENKTEEQTEE